MLASGIVARPTALVARPVSASAARRAPVSSRVNRPASVAPGRRQALSCKAGATEVAQLAVSAGFISGTAATMFAMVLVGLALGFVLLRVESLVEEGKI